MLRPMASVELMQGTVYKSQAHSLLVYSSTPAASLRPAMHGICYGMSEGRCMDRKGAGELHEALQGATAAGRGSGAPAAAH